MPDLPSPTPTSTLNDALAHHQAGRLDQAQTLYHALLEQNPDNPDALHMLGILAAQLGQNDLAADLLRQTILLAPTDATLHAEFAEILRRLDNLPEAVAACTRAITLDPDFFDAHYNLAVILQQQRNLSAAADRYRRALALNPNHAPAHYNLANTLRDLGDLRAAADSYQHAIALNPNYAEAHGNLGLLLHAAKNFDAAIACFQTVIAQRPTDVVAHNSLGNALRDKGEFVQAIGAYGQALALDPNDAATHNNLGKLLHDAGHLDEAIAQYRQAIDAAPTRPEAYQNMGLALEKLGRKTEAIDMYRQALERGASGADARYHMAALTGLAVPAGAPASHVTAVFDELAATFDQHLENLGYQTPEFLLAAVIAAEKQTTFDTLFDLGCGTGLCAPLFRPRTKKLVGVDLSPAMIQKAAERNLYDQLLVGHLTDFLQQHPHEADLLLAADVLIYFGDLSQLFAVAHRALKPRGLFAFSVEAAQHADYRLLPTRRYAHSCAYLQNLAAKNNFTQISLTTNTMRLENHHPVPGYIALFRKQQAAPTEN